VILSKAASMAYAASSLNDNLIAFDHCDGSSCELPCEERRPVVLGWTGRHPREVALR
jgi:hypothetical protein